MQPENFRTSLKGCWFPMLNISVGHPNGELGISEGMEEYIGRLDFPYVTGMHEILL